MLLKLSPKKKLAKKDYADRPAISENDMKGINAAILGLQDLDTLMLILVE